MPNHSRADGRSPKKTTANTATSSRLSLSTGATFDLRAVPNEEPSMSPMEIWCCEAQERYVLAIAPDSLALFQSLCDQGLPLDTLSMGMTDDLEAAIQAGSTMVRVGSGIFGKRR
jgi:hypothetical protein